MRYTHVMPQALGSSERQVKYCDVPHLANSVPLSLPCTAGSAGPHPVAEAVLIHYDDLQANLEHGEHHPESFNWKS